MVSLFARWLPIKNLSHALLYAVPLNEDETFNEKKLRKHVDFVINGGVSAILAFGSNGEFYMQEESEMKDILDDIIGSVLGFIIVCWFCLVYWIARLFGVDLNEDF